MLGDEDVVSIWHTARGGGDVASSLDNLVEGGAIHHEVSNDREGFGTPGFDPYLVAVVEAAHMELAGGDAFVVAVRSAIDVEATHAADTLTAVVVEADGVRHVVVDQLFVELVEHFEE